MAYPLIILGAGASHDYSPLGRVAPLTNQLTDDEFLEHELLEKYPGAGNLLTELVHQVRLNNKSFEQALTTILNRTESNIEIKKQFIGLEYYLKDLFEKISQPDYKGQRRLHQLNNYRALLNRIYEHAGSRACIVTFNYDSLLESNLDQYRPKRMLDYVSQGIKIIKPHGSHDWTYIRARADYERYGKSKDSFSVCMEYPNLLEKVRNDKGAPPYHRQEVLEHSHKNEFLTLPALAIPLNAKDQYLCPQEHMTVLKNELRLIDRILVIGWKAGDPLLIETLRENLPSRVKLLVVSNERTSAEAIAGTLQKSMARNSGSIETFGGGFSKFIASDTSHEFFMSDTPC